MEQLEIEAKSKTLKRCKKREIFEQIKNEAQKVIVYALHVENDDQEKVITARRLGIIYHCKERFNI